jgi:Cysteine-rich CPXCG
VSSGSESWEQDEFPEDEPVQLPEEACYWCESCGEEIVVTVDLSGGAVQDYVEDCPVCCHPNRIHVAFEADGGLRMESESE